MVRVCIAGLIGIALLAVVVLAAVGDADDSRAGSGASSNEVVTLTEYELLSRADTIEPRAYWIGKRPGVDHFELERDPDGNVYLRYLNGNVGAGNPKVDSLTVATYPLVGAQQGLERAARTASGDEKLSRFDGLTVLGSENSTSAYIVFDELPDLQVEIYSPRKGEALELAGSGALTPLHWTPLQ